MHKWNGHQCYKHDNIDFKIDEWLIKKTLQVLQLLESINLQKYKATFEAKAINGITLAQCTEENLKSDLSISSRLDRIRLLNVINTRWVKLIPDADGGNYVVFEKTN